MSYPPNYGYPQPGGQQGPPSSGAGGIGFEGLNGAPSYQGQSGYSQGGNAPYPNAGSAMPGYQTYQQPPAANPYAPSPGGMPPYSAAPAFGAPQPNLSFGGAAYATAAFRPPAAQNYGAPVNNYGPPSAGYAPPAQQRPSVPPQQSYQPAAPQQSHQRAAPQYQHQPAAPQHQQQVSGALQRHNTLPSRHMDCQGTVKEHSPFHAQQDADVLRKAMKGWGCDEKAITHILATRSNAQCQKILLEYKTAYGRDLIKDLKSELGGNYEDVMIALMYTPADYDATSLRKAMKGLGTDEDTLIEILCTRTNAEIQQIRNSFKQLFDRDLEKDLYSETSGNFRKLLVSQVQGRRDETQYVDLAKAQQDAQALYKAGEGRWGTDESRFNVILADRSYPQLRATFEEYKKICKHTIESSIEREMSGDLKKGMLAIVQCVKNTPAYFAEQLKKSMKGLGTSDETLIRICISRSEIDMVQIKQEFANMYGHTLGRYIADDTSGNYKKVLIELIGGVH